jgi:hypothetical protein
VKSKGFSKEVINNDSVVWSSLTPSNRMHVGKRIKYRTIEKKRQNSQIIQRANSMKELLSLFVLYTFIENIANTEIFHISLI